MCDSAGQSAQALPVALSEGDVVLVLTQPVAQALYLPSSVCSLTFRATNPSCGLRFEPLSFSFEDGFDFIRAYNYSAPPEAGQGSHISVNFQPWNQFVPSLTGLYN
jgi:hypothetical protein